MPDGKPAGITCLHLDQHMACRLFNDPRRPAVCAQFTAEVAVCAESREEALEILTWMEVQSSPEVGAEVRGD